MAEHWSLEEVEATVSDYLEMLAKELRSEPYNKAEHNRNLQALLSNRSQGAVELKHQNISAVLIELGYPYIDGYKPRANYQRLLYEVVESRLHSANRLNEAAQAAAEQTQDQPPVIDNVLGILVSPPSRESNNTRIYESPRTTRRILRRNYLELESRNQALGTAGEQLVLEYEHQRLWQSGRKDLANRIEHVARTKGDHLGFDILSFETDDREKLIEVKTTSFGGFTPFFASKNEVEVSQERAMEYHLYRLFNFSKQPKLFVLPGSLRTSCLLDPIQYSASPL